MAGPPLRRRSAPTGLQRRRQPVIVLVGQGELRQQAAERQPVLAEFTDRRMHPRLTVRARHRRAVLGEGLAQPLALVHQPAHLEQQGQLRIGQLVGLYRGRPEPAPAGAEIARNRGH